MSTNWNVGGGNTNNGSIGLGGSINGIAQGFLEQSSSQNGPLGGKIQFDDGRAYRYAKAVAALNSAAVVSTDSVQLIAADTTNGWTAAAAGSTSVTMTDSTLSSATANLYAGAYLGNLTNLEQYRIKSNTAAASNVVTFHLYDGVVTAFAANDDYIITPNPYASVITATVTTGDTAYDRIVGVAPRAVTSGYYFWLQTAGIGFAKNEGAAAIVLGDTVALSDSTAGCIQTSDAGADQRIVGQALGAAATGVACPILIAGFGD